MPNKVILKSYSNVRKEWAAESAIAPGMLIELTSSDTVQPHSTAAGNAIPMFAIENALEGEDLGDSYAADDQVQCWYPQRGDEVYACLADGENIAIGDYLVSNGDGMLAEFSGSLGVVSGGEYFPAAVVARALEARNLSTSSGGETGWSGGYNRIRVEIV